VSQTCVELFQIGEVLEVQWKPWNLPNFATYLFCLRTPDSEYSQPTCAEYIAAKKPRS
jgi:hypothetical protein